MRIYNAMASNNKQKRKGSGPISRVLCHPLAHSASLFLRARAASGGGGVCHLSNPQVAPMALASYPPSSFFENGLNEQLSNDGIRELAASGRAQPTGRPNGWWALTPPSHPYRCTGASQPWAHHAAAVVFFCSLPLSPAASIFRSRALYAARTFLSPPPPLAPPAPHVTL